jgi:hypothetical protein
MKSNITRKLVHLEVSGKPRVHHSISLVLNHQHIQEHPVSKLENGNVVMHWKHLSFFHLSIALDQA